MKITRPGAESLHPFPRWKQGRVTALKALSVLNPETGKPTALLEAVKALKPAPFNREIMAGTTGQDDQNLCPKAVGNGR